MAKAMFVHPGTPKTGYWCPDCVHPSVIVIPYYWVTTDGVTPATSNTVCTECKKHFTPLSRGSDVPD